VHSVLAKLDDHDSCLFILVVVHFLGLKQPLNFCVII
jgi:hypothetical protein